MLLAMATSVAASLRFTNAKTEMFAGQPITLTWPDESAEGKVTINLMRGESDNLKYVDTITAQGVDGTFTWTPPEDLESGMYAFAILDESDSEPNYSASFEYEANESDATDEEKENSSITGIPTSTATGFATNTTMTTMTTGSSNSTITASASSSTDDVDSETTPPTNVVSAATSFSGLGTAAMVGLMGAVVFCGLI